MWEFKHRATVFLSFLTELEDSVKKTKAFYVQVVLFFFFKYNLSVPSLAWIIHTWIYIGMNHVKYNMQQQQNKRKKIYFGASCWLGSRCSSKRERSSETEHLVGCCVPSPDVCCPQQGAVALCWESCSGSEWVSEEWVKEFISLRDVDDDNNSGSSSSSSSRERNSL